MAFHKGAALCECVSDFGYFHGQISDSRPVLSGRLVQLERKAVSPIRQHLTLESVVEVKVVVGVNFQKIL